MSTVQTLKRTVKHLKCNYMLQGTNHDMPTEASWAFVKEIPTMGSMMEQQRVNMEHANEALEDYKYVRVLKQQIFTRK